MATFVSLLGIVGAGGKAAGLVDEGVWLLAGLDGGADLLRLTAGFVVDRRN
jgi:hypothetical protein